MKKLLLTLTALCVCLVVSAQETNTASATERNEWLTSFSSVVVNAPADIAFVRVPESEAPKIVYDTKGSYTTKFKVEVKDKALYISERTDSRRIDRTSVTVYYNTLESAKLESATVTFTEPVETVMFDLTVGGDAVVTMPMQVKDLKAEISGRSRVTFTGTAKYLSMFVSTGKVDAKGLEVTSAQINAQSSAEVALWVTERLDAKTTTKAKISYKGSPVVIRTVSTFLGRGVAEEK